MQIGEIIRKYRKKINMTQEEMAHRLGVTAPAVNKWENGNSMPDITLLSPIARLLDISLDTLLSFHDKLTTEEINHFIYEAEEQLNNRSYEEAFQWAKKIIEEYPNCTELFLQLAIIFDGKRLIDDFPNPDKYDDYITGCYIRALKSENEITRNRAADSLFAFYSKKEQYDKAEEYLSFFSIQNPERKRKQALLYQKTGRIKEAYKALEELLFSDYQMASMTFHNLYMLAMQDNNSAKAHSLIEKQSQLANVFDMGEYYEVCWKLDLATSEKDTDTVIETMEKMLASIENISDFQNSPLYEHMEFRESKVHFTTVLKEKLLLCFRDKDTYHFLQNNPRWQELVKGL